MFAYKYPVTAELTNIPVRSGYIFICPNTGYAESTPYVGGEDKSSERTYADGGKAERHNGNGSQAERHEHRQCGRAAADRAFVL